MGGGGVEGEGGAVAGLGEGVELGVGVVLAGDGEVAAELCGCDVVGARVKLGDFGEELGEEGRAEAWAFGVEVAGCGEDVGVFGNGHGFLLLGVDDENDIVNPGHDLVGGRKNGHRAGGAGGFGVGMPTRAGSMSVRNAPR